jgi:hypothetical protein
VRVSRGGADLRFSDASFNSSTRDRSSSASRIRKSQFARLGAPCVREGPHISRYTFGLVRMVIPMCRALNWEWPHLRGLTKPFDIDQLRNRLRLAEWRKIFDDNARHGVSAVRSRDARNDCQGHGTGKDGVAGVLVRGISEL